jgi:hypothetical protein
MMNPPEHCTPGRQQGPNLLVVGDANAIIKQKLAVEAVDLSQRPDHHQYQWKGY